MPLESALVDPLPKEVLPIAEARKIDLEMAVIMQVCCAVLELYNQIDSPLLECCSNNTGADGHERGAFSIASSSLFIGKGACYQRSTTPNPSGTNQTSPDSNGKSRLEQFIISATSSDIHLFAEPKGIVDLCEAEDVKAEGSAVGPEERERRMQGRIQELVSTVERVTQNAELRQQQSAELVNDVKKANA